MADIGNSHVDGAQRVYLQTHQGFGAALVKLTSRVKKPGAVSHGHGEAKRLGDCLPKFFQRSFQFRRDAGERHYAQVAALRGVPQRIDDGRRVIRRSRRVGRRRAKMRWAMSFDCLDVRAGRMATVRPAPRRSPQRTASGRFQHPHHRFQRRKHRYRMSGTRKRVHQAVRVRTALACESNAHEGPVIGRTTTHRAAARLSTELGPCRPCRCSRQQAARSTAQGAGRPETLRMSACPCPLV